MNLNRFNSLVTSGRESGKRNSSILVEGMKSENVNRSVVSDFSTPWTVVRQAPLSMEFSRQEYQSR